jgi:hypothetical protein
VLHLLCGDYLLQFTGGQENNLSIEKSEYSMQKKSKAIGKFIYATILILFILPLLVFSQVENVPISHPVYEFLFRSESRGLLPHFSTSQLPLQRNEIISALNIINQNKDKLTDVEKHILDEHLIDFNVLPIEKAVLIYSETEKNQVFSSSFFHDNDKYIYYFQDSVNSVKLKPLASVEALFSSEEVKSRNVTLGELGFRLYGSLGKHFGYFLQATNGMLINGDRNLALEEFDKLKQNVKFADLNSDFDFSESHIRFDYDWFYAIIGRETRLVGSGIAQRLFVSNNAAPGDAFSIGARFSNFEYRYTHSGILAVDQAVYKAGFNSSFPEKYLVTHRFELKPDWGEVAFWEGIIYSKRGIDLAYINPLSFFKSLEHALHDRDNSLMGGDLTIRFLNNLQLKGSYLLDDIRFEEIGTGYWSNKSAWNIGLTYNFHFNLDIGLEYARVEPYTFSHFDSINSYTNDEMLIGTGLLPNSDEISLILKYWWFGSHHPMIFKVSNERHGANIYDENGDLIKNVGADPLQTRRPDDNFKVRFLDGELIKSLKFDFHISYEFIKDFQVEANYSYRTIIDTKTHLLFIKFSFVDF